jgi:selenocysteine-specific elongation factor
VADGSGPTVVIGTAGHIDHGKTSLLRALTGIDADRLPEERARGMTIDVGYAHMTFDDGVELDFVDVPGHGRLIGNMLVGAGEIDAAMLVVAADDGPRPQTIEHHALLEALGIAHGLVVITKVDLVDAGRVAEVVAAVQRLLRPTALRSARVFQVSSTAGTGIDDLRGALRDVVVSVGPTDGPVRIGVDRVFSAKGRGTVVTGSLRGGSVGVGQTLRREPGGEAVRIRELQVHGMPRERHEGGRTALNVVGLGVDALHRGDVLTTSPRVRGTDRFLAHWSGSARPKGELTLHIGTAQVPARARAVRGSEQVVRVDTERPVATFEGDRGLLREPGRGDVAGGIRVLDVAPPRGISQRRLTPERLAALAAAVDANELQAIDAARIELMGSW